jgi:uncharacterized phage-associated protein
MFFRFSTKKMIQAVGVLLRQARGRMGQLRLLKLLYIADRQHLQAFQRPIVGTRLVAMKNGPLHSEVYDLVKGEHVAEPLWSEYIRREGYEVELSKDPGVSELSAAEVRTLTTTFDRYQTLGEWDLAEVTHDFPEWIESYPDQSENTSHTIPFDSLLNAIGLQKDKPAILNDLQETARIDQLFSRS